MGVLERRQREREERRESILDAAEAVFVEKGVAATTVDEIAQRAELSKGAVYLYFGSKDELYLAIAVRALGALFERLCHIRDESHGYSGFDRLGRLLEAYVRFAVENETRFRVAMSWLSSNYSVSDESPSFVEYRRFIARVFELGTEAIDAGKADGSVRHDVDTYVLAVELWAALVGLLTLRMNRVELMRRMPLPFDLDELVASFVDLLLCGVRGNAPPSQRQPREPRR
jgi:AcrR family transcriptional regulator